MAREVWDCLKREGSARTGVPAPAEDDGTVSAYGVTVRYLWNAEAQALEVTVTRLPAGVDCGAIEHRVRQAVRACGGE